MFLFLGRLTSGTKALREDDVGKTGGIYKQRTAIEAALMKITQKNVASESGL